MRTHDHRSPTELDGGGAHTRRAREHRGHGELSLLGRSPGPLNRRGDRLSTRGAYNALTTIADAAGIDVGRDAQFTPHVLRHTAGTTMTRAGTDIILVAEILGHSVETARRYALPTHEDRHAAISRLTTDE